MSRTALVVDADASSAGDIYSMVRQAGYTVATAHSFEEARQHLAQRAPDLLVTATRLGVFNGIYLVVRLHAAHPSVLAVVTDVGYDIVLEDESRRAGAIYLVKPFTHSQLLDAVRDLQRRTSVNERRTHGPRKCAPHTLLARIADAPVRVVDVSYGGVRLETPRALRLRSTVVIDVPAIGLPVRVRPIWRTRRSPATSSHGEVTWWYGGELLALDSDPVAARWRALVDSLG